MRDLGRYTGGFFQQAETLNMLFPTVPSRIVATKLPPGKVLYEVPGVSSRPRTFEAFVRECGGCPSHIEIVPSASVGLRWFNADTGVDRDPEGKLAASTWCVLINQEDSNANYPESRSR